ncbi:DEAD/DEAH box helicase [Pedobacter nyackensis]|uniref:DEAD/DEAH box helicase n=1 Tax=Pedobacter nyackensis TaxID=475255 RepID=UPI00292FD6A7|nr:DEAD/DEAH box helicase [Pedobacter nyackensis]
MKLSAIVNREDTNSLMQSMMNKIHTRGPINIVDFEYLAYVKKFQPETFKQYEKNLISIIGLFYKTSEATGLMQEIYAILADTIEQETGRRFTPVQADAFKKIKDNIYFSFSAPTSAGKSFLFREIISKASGDIIIVVPSRALIAEYMHILSALVDKDVLVLQFIEIVNIFKTKRRIYIITPERGIELFKHISRLNIELFLFDEAQIADEDVRGMKFDSFVRRVDKFVPNARKVFTHPFIQNPEAQLSKHNFQQNADHYCYKQYSVGKIYLSTKNDKFSYFSPFDTSANPEIILAQEDIILKKLCEDGTVLIYTSKSKIYKGEFLLDFARYIDVCQKLTDPRALEYIEELRTFIGASVRGREKHSNLIEMMEKGIVIHHGSIPLKARLIIEAFVNNNFARICFSTSTLIQGINMPFDVVWINNFVFNGTDNQKNLDLKNLIGRAGRSTQTKNSFDFGYVTIEEKNMPTFKSRMQEASSIRATSLLDDKLANISEDMKDIVQAIKNDTFNDELQLTQSQVNRINVADLDTDILYILDHLLIDNVAIRGRQYYNLTTHYRKKIKQAFQNIFIAHLRRQDLTKSEKAILSASIPLLLWQIQGKSFAEIVSLRHAYLTDRTEQRLIIAKVKRNEITATEGAELRKAIKIKRSPMAAPLPNAKVRAPNLFDSNESVLDLDYDRLVYDTYDYLDKVIGHSLTDPLCAAFLLYYEKTKDIRALTMWNYIKYGTNDDLEIWLLKYGFSFDDVEWIQNYVDSVDENQIIFNTSISELDAEQAQIIERFL